MYCDIDFKCAGAEVAGTVMNDVDTGVPSLSFSGMVPGEVSLANQLIAEIVRKTVGSSSAAQVLSSIESDEGNDAAATFLSSVVAECADACRVDRQSELSVSILYTLWNPVFVEETEYEYDYETGEPYPVAVEHWERERYGDNELIAVVYL